MELTIRELVSKINLIAQAPGAWEDKRKAILAIIQESDDDYSNFTEFLCWFLGREDKE